MADDQYRIYDAKLEAKGQKLSKKKKNRKGSQPKEENYARKHLDSVNTGYNLLEKTPLHLPLSLRFWRLCLRFFAFLLASTGLYLDIVLSLLMITLYMQNLIARTKEMNEFENCGFSVSPILWERPLKVKVLQDSKRWILKLLFLGVIYTCGM